MKTLTETRNSADTGHKTLEPSHKGTSSKTTNTSPIDPPAETKSLARRSDCLPTAEPGWSEQRDAFLLGTTLIGSQDYQVDATSAETGFVTNQSLDDWKNMNRETLRTIHLAAFSVFLALTGPIWFLMEKHPRAFHFYGKNENAKRKLIDLGNSVYGDPDKLYSDWNLTRSGAEALLRHRNHTFVGLGDLPGTATREAALIGYSLANGRTRARACHDGNAIPQSPWTESVASTGYRPFKIEVPRSRNIPSYVWNDKSISIPVDELSRTHFGSSDPSSNFDPVVQTNIDAFCSDDPHGSVGPKWIEILVQDPEELQTRLLSQQYVHAAFVASQHDHLSSSQTVTEEFGLIAATGRVCAQMGLLPMDAEAVSKAVYEVEKTWLRSLGTQAIAHYERLLLDLENIIQQANEQRPNCRQPEFNCIADRVLSDRTGTFIKASDFRLLCAESRLLTANQNEQSISQDLVDAGVILRKTRRELSWQKWSNGKQSRYRKINTEMLGLAVRNIGRFRIQNGTNRTEFHRESPQDRIQKIRKRIAQRASEVSHND